MQKDGELAGDRDFGLLQTVAPRVGLPWATSRSTGYPYGPAGDTDMARRGRPLRDDLADDIPFERA